MLTGGEHFAHNFESGLMAILLVAHEALTMADINDVEGLGVFAQQLYGFGVREMYSSEYQHREIVKK